MEHCDPFDEISADQDDEGDCPESKSADFDEPKQPRLNSRQYSNMPKQCEKIEAMLIAELAKYPLVQKHLYNLATPVRVTLMDLALEQARRSTEPRVAYFIEWLINEVLPDPNRTLNFSDYARRINIERHKVTREILPKAIRAVAKQVDRALFYFLLAVEWPD